MADETNIKQSVMVVGAAHLEVLALARNRLSATEGTGEISIEVSGTACNIAINMTHAGAQVRFLSAMNTSVYSKVVAEYLATMGVEPHIDYQPDLPTVGLSAHIDTNGKIMSSISSEPIERAEFTEEKILATMEGTIVIVLDCNLSVVEINRIVGLANARNIPVYVVATSEGKSARIAEITGTIKWAFFKQNEYLSFLNAVGGSASDPTQHLRCIFLVTGGTFGSTATFRDGTVKHIATDRFTKSWPNPSMGMTEAITAGVVVLHETQDIPFDDAAEMAMTMAS